MGLRVGNGIMAGLFAGVFFGLIMHMTAVPTRGVTTLPLIGLVAMILGSTSLFVGWVYHLFNSVVIGGLFGYFLRGQPSIDTGKASAWGLMYGFVWYIVGGLILMPWFLGMAAFAPLTTEALQPTAVASLIGHLVYGAVLGASYAYLQKRSGAVAYVQQRPAHQMH